MSLIEFLFPSQCAVCSKVGTVICRNCIKKIPRCLPCCPICGKINTNHSVHKKCHKEILEGFTGWYVSNQLEKKLNQKLQRGIFSVHQYLLNNLINSLNLQELVNSSYILPLYSEDKDCFNLNCYLSKNISKIGKKRDILLVGNTWGDINSNILNKKGLPIKKPLNLRILVLFQLPNWEEPPRQSE